MMTYPGKHILIDILVNHYSTKWNVFNCSLLKYFIDISLTCIYIIALTRFRSACTRLFLEQLVDSEKFSSPSSFLKL